MWINEIELVRKYLKDILPINPKTGHRLYSVSEVYLKLFSEQENQSHRSLADALAEYRILDYIISKEKLQIETVVEKYKKVFILQPRKNAKYKSFTHSTLLDEKVN